MNKTKIEWCDSTWNPVTGCLHGCEYCYARKIASRFGGWKYTPGMLAVNVAEDKTYIHPMKKYYGEANETKFGKVAVIKDPFLKDDGSKAPYPFGFVPTFHEYKLDMPKNWKKPRTIFVCSMADLFGDWVPDSWIEKVFEACEKAPQHRYLFLTKNSRRYTVLHYADKLPTKKDMRNIWLGATATNCEQIRALDLDRLPRYANTFLSIEPLTEDVALELHTERDNVMWLIIGAETGNRKNKIVPQKEWVENICRVADEAGLPVFMKDSLIPIVGEENMRREFPWIT